MQLVFICTCIYIYLIVSISSYRFISDIQKNSVDSKNALNFDLDLAWTLYGSNNSPQDGRASSFTGNSSSPRIGRPSTSSLPPDVIPPMSPYIRPDTPQSPLVNNSPAFTPTEFYSVHQQIPLGVTVSVPLITPSSPHKVLPGRRYTPPNMQQISTNSKQCKFPTTPPPKKRNILYPDVLMHPLTKSISHESQLSVKVGSPNATETDK